MKKVYEKPEIEITQIFAQDVIMTEELGDESLLMNASMAVTDAGGINFN